MKNKVNFLLGVILLLWTNLLVLNSQSIKIIGVDTRLYPIMQAEFFADSGNGKSIRNYPTPSSNFTLIDGGIQRTVTEVICPPGISKFSIILVIDISRSMDSLISYNPPGPRRMDLAKNAAKSFINKLPVGRSECALITFDALVENITPFIPAENRQIIIDSINQSARVRPRGGTDYNVGFLEDNLTRRNPPNPGALEVAKTAKYKPIVIFLTDGNHDPNLSLLNTNEIIKRAKEVKATIYCLTLGNLNPKYLTELSNIAHSTQPPGELYENLSENEIEEVYTGILEGIDPSEFPAPCMLKWETDCDGGEIDLTLNIPVANAAKTTFKYNIPDSVKPALELMNNHPRDILFLNVDPKGSPGYKDTTIKIRSIQSLTKLTGFNTDPLWSITNPSNLNKTINKNDSLSVTIRYTPKDSLCHQTNATFESSACSGENLRLHSGFFFNKNADMGNVEVNTSKSEIIKQEICNWTCDPIKIISSNLKGSDASAFQILTPLSNVTVPAGGCIDVEFKFSPKEVRQYSADFEIQALRFTFKSKITGNGIGNSGIVVNSQFQFSNTNCKITSRDTLIRITNPGGVKLNVTDLNILPNENDFKFKGGKPGLPLIIDEKGGYKEVAITFSPSSKGQKISTLRIMSDAKDSPTKDVELKGFSDTVDIKTDVNEIDFGVICPDSTMILTLRAINYGTVAVDVNCSVSSPFNLAVNNFNISGNGGTQDITINFSSAIEGDFSQTLTLVDALCNYTKSVTVKGKVAVPGIIGGPLVISTTIGSPKQGKVTVTNNSSRTINITNIVPQSSQFKFINISPKSILAPGESADITIEYEPDQSGQVVNTQLEIKGTPCNFVGYVDLTGNPGKATAIIYIDKGYTEVIGNRFPVGIEIRNKVQVVQSGAKSIDATVGFDETLLKAVGAQVRPGGSYDLSIPGKVLFENMSLDGTNNDEEIGKIEFEVLAGSVSKKSDLTLSDYKSDNGNVNLTPSHGLFTLKESAASISIDKDIKARAGEVFELKIYLSNANNLSQVQKSISTIIEFNGTLFEPWGNTPKGTFDKSKKLRTIKLDNIPIPTSISGKTEIAKYQFRAMLGNSKETSIGINNTKVEVGYVEFNEDDGKFTLEGVCRSDGKDRLFEPLLSAGIISITPNPTNQTTLIEYNIVEEGRTRLILTDMLGSNLHILVDEILSPGTYPTYINAEDLNTGVYVLILQTPTQLFSRTIEIYK